MTNIFFATDADIAQVWQWLFEVPGMKIFEDYSSPDKPNRWFNTWDEISDALDSESRWLLAAWPETAGGRPRVDKISFDADTQRKLGAKGRTALRSPATINVRRNNDQNGCLASASIACWTEKGARQRSILSEEFIDEVDWAKLRSIVSKIQRQVIKSSPAKLRSYPVMPDAYERFRAGEINLWNWGEACSYPSPLVTLT